VNPAFNHRRTLAIATFTLAGLLSPTGRVEACGPFFYDEVFVRPHQPDDLAAFAKGKLGLIQPGFDSNEYAVAFRYLNGGSLDKAEQNSVQPPEPDFDRMTPEEWKAYEAAQKAAEESTPPKLWQKARAEYLPSAPAPNQDIAVDMSSGNFHYQSNFLNCSDHAFQTATLTIRKRAASWGKSSPTLLDWIHAQDAVFSNCNGKDTSMPAAAPSNSPALLRADRAYQIAAAKFYAQKFDEAAQEFTAIAADKDSPWQEWGNYLAARATVRKAFVESKGANAFSEDRADFDPAVMQQAQQILERELASAHPQPSRFDLEAELNFIRIRTEPEKRTTEICTGLSGPTPDPHFKQNLEDLSWILSNNVSASFKTQPPLLTWIAAWRGTAKPQDVYALWQQTHTLPWLVVAIAKADAKSDSATIPSLLSAAEAVPITSPAYQTVFYHRVRLLLELNHLDEARALLDPALTATKSNKPDSWRNALLAERLSAARDFNEFLIYAPRTALETGSQAAVDLRAGCQNRAGIALYGNTTAPCPELDHPLTFDDDATTILNEKTPLSRLIEAAQSPILPANLRQNIAIIAWTRAVMLEDAKSAAALVPLLPKDLGVTAQTTSGLPALVTILRNDGIQPVLNHGIARVASFNQFDQYSDNGWCALGRTPQSSGDNSLPRPVLPQPALFTPTEQQRAAAEYDHLKSLPDSQDLIGQRVLTYAKAHPSDPLVPEALHFTVRATRYGCRTYDPNIPWDQRPKFQLLSKAAFQLLHKNFPNSPWTAKTPYYF
jgi:hypothetical protein